MLYSDKVMDHFNNPRNVGVIEDADGIGEVGNPVCGDMMKITIKVDDTDHINDVKFQTLGCGAAIATSSIVTEMAKGLTLEEAVAISKQQVADELGGLPPAKMHCSVLATDGLKVAVDDYLKKHGREPIAGEVKTSDPNFDPHADEDDHDHDEPPRITCTTTPGRMASAASAASARSRPAAGRVRALMARVFVAMSGGVDSSVTAALLLEQGHDVTGVTMQLWPSSDDEGGCCSVSAVRDARRVCDLLGIPHYIAELPRRVRARGRRPVRRRVRRRAHAQPVHRLQRPAQVRRPARQGQRAGRRLPGDRALRAHRARCGGRAVARARARPGQGPELLPLPAHPRRRWSTCSSPSASCTRPTSGPLPSASACTSPRSPTARRSASPRRGSMPAVVGAAPPGCAQAGDIVDLAGAVRRAPRRNRELHGRPAQGTWCRGGRTALRRARRCARQRASWSGRRSALRVTRVEADDVVWHGGAHERVGAMVRYRMRRAGCGRALRRRATSSSSSTSALEGVAPGQAVVCYREDICLGGGTITCAS